MRIYGWIVWCENTRKVHEEFIVHEKSTQQFMVIDSVYNCVEIKALAPVFFHTHQQKHNSE